VTRQVARRATIIVGLVLAVGCTSVVYTVGPRCPEWSEESVAELGQVLELGKYPALEEAIGRQELWCQAADVHSGEELCVGSRLSCWWRGLWHE